MNTNNPKVDNPVLLWSKRKLWTVRIVLIVLVGAWVGTWLYLHYQIKQGRAKVEQYHMQIARQEQRARRDAIYRQDMNQRTHRVRNAVER